MRHAQVTATASLTNLAPGLDVTLTGTVPEVSSAKVSPYLQSAPCVASLPFVVLCSCDLIHVYSRSLCDVLLNIHVVGSTDHVFLNRALHCYWTIPLSIATHIVQASYSFGVRIGFLAEKQETGKTGCIFT